MHDSRPSDREGFTFYFQFADGVGRRALAVTIASSTRDSAEVIFRNNADAIVQMARDNVALGMEKGATLKLNFP